MTHTRFHFGLLALLMVGSAAAQTTYPEKPVRMVVGFPPGNSPDVIARLLGQKLGETWGKAVLIDNLTGAAGNIAAERIAKAAPDGYTLGLMSQPQIVVNPILYKLTYDPVKDFAPVSQVYTSISILVVHKTVPANTVKELVALAKAQAGALTFASGGSGSGTHMAAELFKSMAGVDIRHIPYKGGAVAMPDVLGGRVTMMFGPIAIVSPVVREGKVHALAVTSLRRSPAFPELPTIHESGYPGFEYTSWGGVLAPARTSASIVRKLHFETVKVLALPELRDKLTDLGLEGVGNSPDEFTSVIRSEIAKWAKLIKEAGIKQD
jgi:tripartite-type tricarboxylate transporter receptor subunit TctC